MLETLVKPLGQAMKIEVTEHAPVMVLQQAWTQAVAALHEPLTGPQMPLHAA